ncbi:hypothetical protein KP509_21G045600 [Ceratopteris richardii]|uniref:Calcineurin-like phosphoesterase domain-containing protein n=1 Tax=Ceratopteris richardii TaxID=49495 RepID=A0A8T2SCE7_CERRI|nr:hypothetical protein KP509_21G045600 [Ceratopteris richardii]KAH7315345.1 hypothetical protein KP509_21G045600 [Ceratopteris richardii]
MEASEGVIVCVGDIHGYADKLSNLWHNLEAYLGLPTFVVSTFIFLGDYCDRGPETRKVLDFLTSLPPSYPSQHHIFLCGNHDFAFAAFLHLLPPLSSSEFSFQSTWEEFIHGQGREGWWSGPGYETMHVQGRRWAGNMQERFNVKKGTEYQGSIYDAGPTFSSYGLPHGDPGLNDAVPPAHKNFLRNLAWIYEQDNLDEAKYGFRKLIAVHAGLEKSKSIEEQINLLYGKDVRLPRVEPFSGRKNVWETPNELVEQGVLIVSGHHGVLHTEQLRLIIDEGGGLPHLPIAAMILPSRTVIRDTDDPSTYSRMAKDTVVHPEVLVHADL